jgi:hypothetical protein
MKREPPKSLEEAIERLRKQNERLNSHLKSGSNTTSVANGENSLDDATQRARKFWDKLEGRNSSIPPKAQVSNATKS